MAAKPDLGRVVWYVVDDTTLVGAYLDPDSGRTAYSRHTTRWRVTETEIGDATRRFQAVLRPGDRVSTPLLVLAALGLVGGLVGWLVLGSTGADEQVRATVLWGSVALVLLALLGLVLVATHRRRALARLQRNTAWDMVEAHGLGEQEAQALLATPGTVTVRPPAAP